MCDISHIRYLLMQRALMSCSIGKSTQLTCFLCRVNTYWQSVLALAMDRLIRVSMKNAASCVIYHEFGEALNAQRRWVFPSARLAQGCLISESVEKFGDTDNTTSSGVLLKVPRSSIFMGQHILRVYTCGCPRMKYDVSYTRLGGMSQMNLFMRPELSPYHSAEEKKLTRIPQVMGKSPALNLSVLGR
uniref:Uncharacterized protein n=1 Tax=Heterorhabditis bacteriophora TaxID=37862 RepID=A0A1I7WDG1_HETBA